MSLSPTAEAIKHYKVTFDWRNGFESWSKVPTTEKYHMLAPNLNLEATGADEIRDIIKDKDLIKTIIHDYGIKYSKNIGYCILTLAMLITIILCCFLENFVFKNSTLIVILITAILLSLSSEKQNKYYSSFIVESVPIYWLIVEIGLQILL